MAETSIDQHTLLEEKSWMESPSTLILLLVVVVLVVGGIMGYFLVETKRQEKLALAQAAFDQAATPEEKLAVAKLHTDSSASAAWLAALGHQFYLQKNYDLSLAAYDLLQKTQPGSSLAPGALLGEAEAFLALNKPTEAMASINLLLGEKDKNAYQPLAQIVLAEWHISQNNNQEARQTLQDLLTQFPGSAFAQEAVDLMHGLPEVEVKKAGS